MTGSSPKPSSRPPRTIRRQKNYKPGAVVWAIGPLFVVYVLVGLLLSMPSPPVWIWIPAAIGMVLLAVGINHPMPGSRKNGLGLLAYLGALLLVVALAIAANYIGSSNQSFDDVRFFVALFGLALLTLIAVVLTAAAAITSAQASAALMRTTSYTRRLTVVLSTCCFGICLGGFIGFITMLL